MNTFFVKSDRNKKSVHVYAFWVSLSHLTESLTVSSRFKLHLTLTGIDDLLRQGLVVIAS